MITSNEKSSLEIKVCVGSPGKGLEQSVASSTICFYIHDSLHAGGSATFTIAQEPQSSLYNG